MTVRALWHPKRGRSVFYTLQNGRYTVVSWICPSCCTTHHRLMSRTEICDNCFLLPFLLVILSSWSLSIWRWASSCWCFYSAHRGIIKREIFICAQQHLLAAIFFQPLFSLLDSSVALSYFRWWKVQDHSLPHFADSVWSHASPICSLLCNIL